MLHLAYALQISQSTTVVRNESFVANKQMGTSGTCDSQPYVDTYVICGVEEALLHRLRLPSHSHTQ